MAAPGIAEDVISQENDNTERGTQLHKAAADGNLEECEKLLKDGVDPNIRDKGELNKTPIMSAAVKGHTETLKLLIKYGGDVNLKNQYGVTALLENVGQEDEHSEVVRILLDAGSDVNHCALGHSALSMATAWGYTNTVRMLIEA